MKKWKFYIDDVEINLDIFNFDELKYVISRDTEYWGYFREASIDKLVFLKQDAQTIKDYFENNGVNASHTFTIKKLNVSMGCYEVFQEGIIDFYNYKEIYNKNNKLFKVEVDVVGNSEQQKIKTREDLDLKIGRNTSVENQSIGTVTAQNVLFKTRPLKLEAFSNIASAYIGVAIPDGQLNNRDLTIPTQQTNSNILFYQNAALGTTQVDSVLPSLLFDEITLREHSETQDTNMRLDFNIDFEYNSIGALTLVNGLKLKIQAYTYDGVDFTFVSSSIIDQIDEDPGTNSGNFSGTALFDKAENILYRLVVECSATLFTITFQDSEINYSYNELSEDSAHKGFLIYETFQNLFEQITDRTNVFNSNLFGRTDLGYATDGEASQIVVTNGLFLRNAELSDGAAVELELNFKDLYKTLDSIYGLSMWFDGDKINIERRSDVFGTNEIELEPQEISRELFTNLLYTDVKVGNKQIKYENTNGTNEYNTTLQFSSPLRIKSNKLELITKYNTDYLGVELAKRLSFATDANVDTKYDDKVFLCKVQPNALFGFYETVLGLEDGFDFVDGVILPDYAGNLDFSPKRMLLRNSDLINAAFFKNQTNFLRFEKSENLAALVTRKTGETTDLEELADLDYSETTTSKFIPMLWNFEVAETDLWKIMNNQLDVFKFTLGCEEKFGYLWKAQIQNDLGKITLIEKQDFEAPAPVDYQASFIFDGINQFIEVADADDLSFGDGVTDQAFSFSIWVYLDSYTGSANKMFFNKTNEYRLRMNQNGRIFFELLTNSSNRLSARYIDLTGDLSTWLNIVCTYDGSKTKTGMKIYINDSEVVTGNASAGTYTGMTNGGGNLRFMGSDYIDGNANHFSVIGKELSAAEVTELYNGGLPIDITTASFASDIVSHWAMDKRDDPTTIVNDIIGTNDGIPYNMSAANLDEVNYPT
jgi:hypothetical protein